MSRTTAFFVTFFVLCSWLSTAQRNYNEYNHLGLYGGYTLMDIQTNNFVTEQGSGFVVGFVTRGDVYNNFDMEYGISFLQSQVGILARSFSTGREQFVNYTLPSAQIKLLGGYNIIRHHLSIDAGPILNVNGKLKPQGGFDDYIIDGYSTVGVNDIDNVSRVHFNIAAGITAGFENFRLTAQYQYGVTNLFARYDEIDELQAEKPDGGFKGNTNTLIFGAYLLF